MSLGYRKAIDRMRQPGARLIKTHGACGYVHYVVPGGYVDPTTAERLKKHPLVRAGEVQTLDHPVVKRLRGLG